ncbi:MAG TPA: hypothetical protein VHZ02_00170, partial [Acidimicrobiales bacterium]|nr:hypothetical protein [Acidimicrobiales bacterium]
MLSAGSGPGFRGGTGRWLAGLVAIARVGRLAAAVSDRVRAVPAGFAPGVGFVPEGRWGVEVPV